MSLRRIATRMGDFRYGAKSVGRLTFRSEAEARGAAAELGLDGTHRHEQDHDNDGTKESVSMPGKNHSKLNKALTERGLEPTMMPGERDMGASMGDDMMEGDMVALDGMGMGGEMSEAGRMGGDEMMVKLDGLGFGGEMSEAGRMGEDEMMVKLDGMGFGGEMSMAAFDGRSGVDAELDDRDADDFNLYGASGSGDLPDGFGVDPDETSSVGGGMLKGLFVGDEDDDDNMEIY